jgi:hypothetical protein
MGGPTRSESDAGLDTATNRRRLFLMARHAHGDDASRAGVVPRIQTAHQRTCTRKTKLQPTL